MNNIKSKETTSDDQSKKNEIERILDIELIATAVLAEKVMKLSDILSLKEGYIIEFKKPWNEPLELMIGGKRIGKGIAMKIGERFGLQLNEIVSPSKTIESLGEKTESK
jgi:flagellar motor switch protein FliN/FliY